MTYPTFGKPLRAVLVGIPVAGVTDAENQESLAELSRLVTTLGFEVVGTMSQRRTSQAGGTVLGDGKLKELAALTGGTGVIENPAKHKKSKAAEKWALRDNPEVDEDLPLSSEEDESLPEAEKAQVVVFDCELTPSQLANLQSATGVEVLDRTGVIVEIFSKHAKTREAKLQVEIARLNYLAPRVRETGGDSGDRLGGTAGETSLELDKRKIRDRIAELRRELVSVQKEQTTRRSQRSEQLSVALVGYTNAGKSSLMRALTGSEVLVADKLFATLDTTVRAMQPSINPRILVSDTVGFIKKLPHDLVASFRSTLEEAANSSLLLFVVDASDPTFRAQLDVTHEVLAEIGVSHIPSKLILNKSDILSADEIESLKREFPDAISLSAKNPEEVKQLQNTIRSFFEKDMVDEEILIPYTAQGAIGEIRSQMRVLNERYEDDGVYLLVRSFDHTLNKLKKSFSLS